MSIKALTWAFEQRLDDPTAKLVLLGIADKYNDDRGFSWPSVQRLAEMADCTERTVSRKISFLEELGYIKTVRNPSTTNQYYLDLTICRGDRGVGGELTPSVISQMTSDVSQTILNDRLTINNVDLAFKRFWEEVPRKDGKKPAYTAFKRALKDAGEDVIIDGIKAYAAMVKRKGTENRFILMPATWLNQARWDDDLKAQEADDTPADNFGVAQKWMPATQDDFNSKVMGSMRGWYESHRPDVMAYAKEKGWL